jgi:hypothetical protein
LIVDSTPAKNSEVDFAANNQAGTIRYFVRPGGKLKNWFEAVLTEVFYVE